MMKEQSTKRYFLTLKEKTTMATAHLSALQKKHEDLEHRLKVELKHAARDEAQIRRLKEQKLHIKERIERLQEGTVH